MSTPSESFRTKTEQVYDILRQEILAGTLAPGDRLPLIALAGRFNLSTIPVREALRMLSRDKLVLIQSHKGAAVAELFASGAIELVETRLWLEIRAAALAMASHTAASIKKLKAFQTEMEQHAKRGQGRKFSEANRKFHTALYEPGQNGEMKTKIQELWDLIWHDRSGSVVEVDRNRMNQVCDEHQEIVSAVEDQNSRKLETAMRKHMDSTLECWRRISQDG